MKKYFFLFSVIALSFSCIDTQAVNIRIYGKGGIVINPDQSYEICPDFAFRTCAIISVSWREIWNYITDNTNNPPPLLATIFILDDNEDIVEERDAAVIWVDPNTITETPPNTLRSCDIKFR
ncbi:MAG: hypothetical protein K0B15_15455 [Lentimicrobium sp.]|nr:hypothetical protein [Lentimicrobium sp.]